MILLTHLMKNGLKSMKIYKNVLICGYVAVRLDVCLIVCQSETNKKPQQSQPLSRTCCDILYYCNMLYVCMLCHTHILY